MFCKCEKRLDELEEQFHRLRMELFREFELIRQRFHIDELAILRLINKFPFSASLTFTGEITMPASIAIGGKGAQAVFTEFSGLNGSGSVEAPIGAVSFASDNTAVATVDPVSGAVTAVAVGTANISGSDAGDGLTASDVITVTPLIPQSATLVLTAN